MVASEKCRGYSNRHSVRITTFTKGLFSPEKPSPPAPVIHPHRPSRLARLRESATHRLDPHWHRFDCDSCCPCLARGPVLDFAEHGIKPEEHRAPPHRSLTSLTVPTMLCAGSCYHWKDVGQIQINRYENPSK